MFAWFGRGAEEVDGENLSAADYYHVEVPKVIAAIDEEIISVIGNCWRELTR